MTIFDIAAVLLGLSALFGFLNHRFLRLPHTIGLVVIALVSSGAVVLIDLVFPTLGIALTVTGTLSQIDFYKTVMHGMLSVLLFAGAVHVNFSDLAARKWAIGLLATAGLLTSTVLVGTVLWLVIAAFSEPIPFIWALLLGALISPTDPVAVLGILKTVSIPDSLKAKIAGESLFNDGVGVVVFTIVLAVAVGGDGGNVGVSDVAILFVVEAGGGALLGIVAGYLAYRAMRSIDEPNLEVLITLALVLCTYSLAIHLKLSGPLAVVIAGLFIGNHGARFAMSEKTRTNVFQFWEVSDEIFNSVLFLLIGLEVLVVSFRPDLVGVALLAIPIVLIIRWISVAIPISALKFGGEFSDGAITILTWGGLRGGISVALALSLPDNEYKAPILTITYAVVVFSIIFQGLTMKAVVARFIKQND